MPPSFLIKLFLSLLLITVYNGVVSAQKDTLLFYHDQMLLGELLSLERGRVHFDSEDAGVVKVKYYKIRSFSATQHSYRIRTEKGDLLFGKVLSSDVDGFINIHNQDSSVVSLDIKSIIELHAYDRQLKERLRGEVSGGYDFTRSSEIGRINFDLNLEYLAPAAALVLNANTIITQEEGDFSRDIATVNSTLQIYLSYRWMAFGLLGYQRNLELGVLRRFQEGAGIGYNLILKSDLQYIVASGIVVNQELTEDSNKSETLFEIPIVMNFYLYEFQHLNLQLQINQNTYFGITQAGRIRSDGNVRLSWEIVSEFTVGLNFYLNYDNQPSEGSSKVDIGTVLNLGYSF